MGLQDLPPLPQRGRAGVGADDSKAEGIQERTKEPGSKIPPICPPLRYRAGLPSPFQTVLLVPNMTDRGTRRKPLVILRALSERWHGIWGWPRVIRRAAH